MAQVQTIPMLGFADQQTRDALLQANQQMASQQSQLARQQAYAQALMGQSLSPIDAGASIGGVAYHVSPMAAVAKALQGYLGGSMGQQNDQLAGQVAGDQMGMQLMQSQALARALGFGAQQGGDSTSQSDPTSSSDPAAGGTTGVPPAQGGASGQQFDPQALAAAMNASGMGDPTDIAMGNASMMPPSLHLTAPPTTGNSPPQAPPMGVGAPAGSAGNGNSPISPQPQLGPMGYPSTPLNQAGMNPMTALMQMQQSPDTYWSAQNAALKPADIVAQLRAAGIDPNSPMGRQVAQDALAKANYIAPTSVRPGGGFIDPRTGQITTIPTQAPPGYQNVELPNGKWSTVPTTGGVDAVQDSQTAQTLGKTSGTMFQGVDADGNPVYMTGGSILGAGGGAASPTNNPGNLRQPGAGRQPFQSFPTPEAGLQAVDHQLQLYGQRGINTIEGLVSTYAPQGDGANNPTAYASFLRQRLGLQPGQKINLNDPVQRQLIGSSMIQMEQGSGAIFGDGSGSQSQVAPAGGAAPTFRPAMTPTQKALNDQGASIYRGAQADAANVQSERQILSEIQSLASNPKNTFGPGTPEIAEIKAQLNNMGIDMTGAQTAQDIMTKLSSNLVTQQLGAGGATGTDKQLDTLIHANPNGEMTNSAILQVLPLLNQRLDVREARSRAITGRIAQGGSMTDIPALYNNFNNLADPQVVQLGRSLAAASRAGTLKQFVGQLPPASRALLPKVQQLDGLGAF